ARMALENHPQLAALQKEISARQAHAAQEGIRPNPVLDIELENFGGSGALDGVEESELTITAGQLIEFGGKRSKRKSIAELESYMAVEELKIRKLEILTRIKRAYISVLDIQNRKILHEEAHDLSRRILGVVTMRVEAGNLSRAEIHRAAVQLAESQIQLERVNRELKTSLINLGLEVGVNSLADYEISGDLKPIPQLPEFGLLDSLSRQNPRFAHAGIAYQRSKKIVELENANRLPDPTFAVGYRRLNESDDNAFVAGISIPLPLSDRNQGAREEAVIRRGIAEDEQRNLSLIMEARVKDFYVQAEGLRSELNIQESQTLPGANQAFGITRERYEKGRSSYLEVLDAQRAFISSRESYLQNLTEYYMILSELEQLTGQTILTFHQTISD
ncbi:MAG: TolC family protein, partial [Calditrichaceae bacterium]